MANLDKVTRMPVVIDLGDGQQRVMKYTLSSFAKMEEKYGSVDKAMEAMESGSMRAVIFMIWAGLRHSDPTLTEEYVGDILEITDLANITQKMGEVMSLDLPGGANPNA